MIRKFTPEEERQRMQEGKLYIPYGKEIVEAQTRCLELLYEYNATRPSEMKKRQLLIGRMFAEAGEGIYVEPPLHANWAGRHVHLGCRVYANFNLTLVDDGEIFIGDDTMIGPNVTIATAGHPILPEIRKEQYQFNIPVHIGKNVWIGAGAVILPGVTIGDDTVIGAGSVVTKDIPPGVVAAGNPCRILREIGERDKVCYYKDHRIDLWEERE